MSILVNDGEHVELAKSAEKAARVAGRNVRRLQDGFKSGIKHGAAGASPIGQVGSGRVGRPTYAITGGSRAHRAGMHAGIAAANAPLAGAAAAVGAGSRRRVQKADTPITVSQLPGAVTQPGKKKDPKQGAQGDLKTAQQQAVTKSAFGIEGVTKAVGDELQNTRGGVAGNYTPPTAAKVPPNVAGIKSKLTPVKSAMVAATKVK